MKVENQQLAKLRQINRSQIIEVEHIVDQQNKKLNDYQKSCSKGDDKKSCDKKSKDPIRKMPKNYCILAYTVFTCLSCLYLQTTQFYPLLKDNGRKAILSKLSYFIVFMALWSYYVTCTTNSSVKKLQGAPHVDTHHIDNKKFIDSNYLTNQCQYCKYYKPPRVSHCSTCGTCIYKLDHHCMWTQNCIGYRNQRPFLFFIIYMTIGLFQFWHGSFTTFNYLYGNCQFFSTFEPGIYILWLITQFSATFVGIMIFALFITHIMFVLTNWTTLMGMKKKSICHMPFCEPRDQLLAQDMINPWDRGQIQNIRSLVGTNVLTCWMPFTKQIENDFIFQEQNPFPTQMQIAILSGQYFTEHDREKEIERLLPQFKQNLKNKKIMINGKMLVF